MARNKKIHMKKSKKISVNIKRAVKELDESNLWGIGNVIFADIIRTGIKEYEEYLKQHEGKRHIISDDVYLNVFEILKKHI